MCAARIIFIVAVAALAGHAQTALFQVLDGPLPLQASTATTMGDLDADGDQDLAGVGVAFMNDGHGRFTALPVPGLDFPRYHSVLVDVNGDGFLDMVSSTYSGLIRIDLGPPVTFVPSPFPLPALPGPLDSVNNFAVGDVDLDGDADILIARFVYPSAVYAAPPVFWLNNGAGQFSVAPAGAVPALNIHGTHLLLRDVDNDGDPDAIFAHVSNPIQVLINTGGTFAPSPAWQWSAVPLFALDVGDFNGDGLPDMVCARGAQFGGIVGSVDLVLNSGQGWVAGGILNNVAFSAIRAVDVNGDGVDEIVGQGWNSSFSSVTLSLHGVSSVPPTIGPASQSWPGSSLLLPGPSNETVRDLDGDGDRDLVVQASQPALLMNTGIGGLALAGGRTTGAIARPQIGDLDLDGDLDFLGLGQNGPAIVTATNAGDGFFSPGAATAVAFPWTSLFYYTLYAFDRDGDGDSDAYVARNIFTANSNALNDVVFDRVGGTFVQSGTVTGTGYTSVFKTADLDADGDLDILLGRRDASQYSSTGITNPMVLLVNNGAAGLGSPVSIGGNHATYDLEIGDFDGNGTLDVFQANNSNPFAIGVADPCALYLFAPNLTYTVVSLPFSGIFTASGDLNGDGMTDLIADAQVLVATGGGSFVPGTPLPSALAAPAALADVDLDGDLDLFEAPGTVMFNAGGVFGAPVSCLPRNTSGPTLDLPEPVLADFDGDGDLDAVAPGPLLLVNTMRQIARGSVPRPGRPASMDLYGTPAGAWFLWASNGTASIPLPPWGTVFIDPASAQLGAMGQFTGPTAPLPGTATLSVLVPNNPALVGWTTYWQSVDAAQLRLSNRLTITVMGY